VLISLMQFGPFPPQKPENSTCCDTHLMVTSTSFSCTCNHLPTPALCKVFELGIDRAHEVELLFAQPAFELFFPSDGRANVFVTPNVEQVRASVVEKVRTARVR
jgi:hypothetical protein